jgi:hypothetical protein
MMLAYRTSRAQVPVLPTLSFGTVELHRASSPLLALALLLSIAFAGLTGARIVRIERDFQPALQDTRELSVALDAIQGFLRGGRPGVAESQIARADSLARHFHLIAGGTRDGADQGSEMLGYGAAFADYYVAARRAAASLSMSLDADGSSAEDSRLGYSILHANLAAGIQTLERSIDAARPATAPVELAGWLALTLLSAAALLRRRQVGLAPEGASAAAGARYDPIPAGDGASTVPLRDAVERLARRRLAASVAAARVARRNNERQIELARSWNVPMLSIVPVEQPIAGMDVYGGEQVVSQPTFGRLKLVNG